MLAGSTSAFGLGLDYAVILLTTTILVFIGGAIVSPARNVNRS